jgi:hypothetical protein
MQVIEAHNPFIFADRIRQQLSASLLGQRPGVEKASAIINSVLGVG